MKKIFTDVRGNNLFLSNSGNYYTEDRKGRIIHRGDIPALIQEKETKQKGMKRIDLGKVSCLGVVPKLGIKLDIGKEIKLGEKIDLGKELDFGY